MTMTLVKTNDLKKGDRVLLRNGWYATLADNRKGDIRVATVEGMVTETGSIYAHDIMQAHLGASWVKIAHTPKQLDMQNRVTNWGF
jgi:preprotein translocase subunit YajC